jgi:hypothetical protein
VALPTAVPQFLESAVECTGPREAARIDTAVFSYVGLAATIVPLAFSVQISAACRTSTPPLLR